MSTKELEKCLHVIGYWMNEDEAVIDILLKEETQFVTDYVEPFRKELNSNLLFIGTVEAKKDLIKYYVFEFWELIGFFKINTEILLTGSLRNYTPRCYEHKNKAGEIKTLSKFENYVVNSWLIFDMLLNEIQLCCFKYKIDFLKICSELGFSTEYFDVGISLALEEMTKNFLTPLKPITESIRISAKHYVLAYLIECNAKGESFPLGKKKEIEQIGNKRMGAGKGNTFYKNFNKIINKDLNAEKTLIEIGGENWRKLILDLSNDPNVVEKYLQSKQL